MLRSLTIRDFVIVDRLDLEFEPGFGALTGETGAGKSILLDAFALALGARHLSAYHLTLEPNTLFAARPPANLPDDDLAADMQEAIEARRNGVRNMRLGFLDAA